MAQPSAPAGVCFGQTVPLRSGSRGVKAESHSPESDKDPCGAARGRRPPHAARCSRLQPRVPRPRRLTTAQTPASAQGTPPPVRRPRTLPLRDGANGSICPGRWHRRRRRSPLVCARRRFLADWTARRNPAEAPVSRPSLQSRREAPGTSLPGLRQPPAAAPRGTAACERRDATAPSLRRDPD